MRLFFCSFFFSFCTYRSHPIRIGFYIILMKNMIITFFPAFFLEQVLNFSHFQHYDGSKSMKILFYFNHIFKTLSSEKLFFVNINPKIIGNLQCAYNIYATNYMVSYIVCVCFFIYMYKKWTKIYMSVMSYLSLTHNFGYTRKLLSALSECPS